MIGVYFQTWSSRWAPAGDQLDLSKVEGVELVYLSFCKPDLDYKKGQNTFAGTGLEFSSDFSVVKKAIEILKQKGIQCMLSVGGGAYWSTPKPFYSQACLDLMSDLGCYGIDVDWEVGARDDKALTQAIKDIRSKSSCKISFAGFSTGAYGKDGDAYKGMSIDAMVNAGSSVDWINIMAYDAGKNYDPIGAFTCYRMYYKGPLHLGYLVGKHGWGDGLLTRGDVEKNTAHIVKENPSNGVFLWSWQKSNDNVTPSVNDVVTISRSIFHKPDTPVTSVPSSAILTCPKCKDKITVSLS